MQLVANDVLMLDPMKNLWIDENKVKEKFGVLPDKVIDVQALAGDSSDNIPGVPGIGLKTAADLINEFKWTGDRVVFLVSAAAAEHIPGMLEA